MCRNVVNIFILMCFISCNYKISEDTIEVTQIQCLEKLNDDPVVNSHYMKAKQSKNLNIQCFKFKNRLSDEVFFNTHSLTGELMSVYIYHFKNGENRSDITCHFDPMKQIFLKKNETANAYLLSSKYQYDFDSTLTTFTFYNVKDSSETVINIKNGAKNHH